MHEPRRRGSLAGLGLWFLPRAGLLVLLLPVALCGQTPRPSAGAEALGALEDRLLASGRVALGFTIEASGVADISLTGRFEMEDDGRVDLQATGHFAGQPVELGIKATKRAYRFGLAPQQVVAATPDHLREALVVGMVRMGLLHNLARLTGNAPPDHAEGGVREWVVTEAVAGMAPTSSDGAEALRFDLVVDGQPAGTATLELDGGGLPLLRTQRVAFPQGEMTVLERYTEVRISP